MNRRTFLAVSVAAAVAGCTGESTETPPGPLAIEITDGTAAPGETVTLQVTAGEDPVENATVRVDYRTVGTTNETGHLTVTLPHEGDDVAIDAEKGDREGERSIEFTSGGQTSADELSIAVVEGTPGPGATITVEVTADGDPVAGAEVEVAGETAGTTDADGRLTVTLPETEENAVEIRADSGDLSGERTITFDN